MTDIRLSCTESRIVAQYRKMQSDGVVIAPEDADVSCDDVIDAALAQGERYETFLRRLTRRTLPWALDDRDPSTDFDDKLRLRIDEAIAMVRRRLLQQGFRPESWQFQRRLATALYLFIHAPSSSGLARLERLNPQGLSVFTAPLTTFGLLEFRDHLRRVGGLAALDFDGDASLEATALEALSTRRGLCTERSKIIYAVLKRAGLNPIFARMTVRQTREAWFREYGSQTPPPVTPGDFLGGHIIVALRHGVDVAYFESNAVASEKLYEGYATPMTLREAYFIDMNNLLLQQLEQGKIDAAERTLAGATALGKTSLHGRLVEDKARVALAHGDPSEALTVLRETSGEDYDSVSIRLSLCGLYMRYERAEEAKVCLEQLPPDVPQRALGFASVAQMSGDYDGARRYWEKALELGVEPARVYGGIGQTFLAQGKLVEAEDYLRRAFYLHPTYLDVIESLADVLLRQHKWNEVVDVLQPAMVIPGTSYRICDQMIEALEALQRTREAHHYYRRSLFLVPTSSNFTYEMSEHLQGRASRYGEWKLVADVMSELERRGPTRASVALLFVEAASHVTKMKSHSHAAFSSLLGTIATDSSLPPRVYWRLVGIGREFGSWKELVEFCDHTTSHPAYQVYILHAAWSGRNVEVERQVLSSWDQFLERVEGVKPEDRNVKNLEKMAMAIDELPVGLVRNVTYLTRLERFLMVLVQTAEASGDGSSAKVWRSKILALRSRK